MATPAAAETPRDTVPPNIAALLLEYQGALPPIAALRELEQLVPGSAATVIAALQSQSAHRTELETMVARANERATTIAQVGSVLLGGMVLGVAAICAANRAFGWAVAVIAVAAVAVGTARVLSQWDRAAEMIAKARYMSAEETRHLASGPAELGSPAPKRRSRTLRERRP